MESSILSLNPNLYGSLHNNGHNAIAYIHDPDNRFLVRIFFYYFINKIAIQYL